jgi:hypothetical protein
MKITLNLSPAESLRDRYALAWAAPATLFGLMALVLLGHASIREYRDYRGIEQQLSEIQARQDALRNRETAIRQNLEGPKNRALLGQVRFVNQLIDQRQLSLTEVSARVAGLLPEDAHLTGLALTSPKKPGDDYVVRMGITAKGEDAVETFINDLEDSVDFKDVTIVNQGFQVESSLGDQVNIVCTARYLPGAEKAFEDASQVPEAGSAKTELASQLKVGSQKSEVNSQAAGAKSPKSAGRARGPNVVSQKTEKGAKVSRAQESTPSR